MDIEYEAQVVDAHHLKLIKPIEIAPGSMITIIIELANAVSEDQDFYNLSVTGLENAYHEDEPVYTNENIIKINPEYDK